MAFTLGQLGYPPALGLSTAFLMRLKTLLDAGYGAILHPLVCGRRSIQDEIRSEQTT